MIYFLVAEALDAVKIGVTDRNPEKRIADIQANCPCPLKLLRTALGDIKEERRLHKAFREHHINNEWFRYSPIKHVIAIVEPRMFYAICTVCERRSAPTQFAWESRKSEPLRIRCDQPCKQRRMGQSAEYDRAVNAIV